MLKSEWPKLGFFKRGWIIAFLKAEGNMPSFKELFMTDKMLGPTVSKTSLRNLVGIKTRLHAVSFIWNIVSDKKGAGLKLVK